MLLGGIQKCCDISLQRKNRKNEKQKKHAKKMRKSRRPTCTLFLQPPKCNHSSFCSNSKVRGVKSNLRGGNVVEHQKQAVSLGMTPPVVTRPHGLVDLIVDRSFPVKIGDDILCKIRRHTSKTGCNSSRCARVWRVWVGVSAGVSSE